MCPDCGTTLTLLDRRPGYEHAACPIALRGNRIGKIGPGFRHAAAWVWPVRREVEAR